MLVNPSTVLGVHFCFSLIDNVVTLVDVDIKFSFLVDLCGENRREWWLFKFPETLLFIVKSTF